MADVFTTEQRSRIMSRIKSGDSEPELLVRRLVHSLGHRFRLHIRELPGTPDIVLSRLRKVIFVNGCFWHGHARCSRARLPSTNEGFWQTKIDGNRKRDRRVTRQLKRMGWSVLIVWQCQTRNHEDLCGRLRAFLQDG